MATLVGQTVSHCKTLEHLGVERTGVALEAAATRPQKHICVDFSHKT